MSPSPSPIRRTSGTSEELKFSFRKSFGSDIDKFGTLFANREGNQDNLNVKKKKDARDLLK